MALTDLLNKAVAAGVPAERLKAVDIYELRFRDGSLYGWDWRGHPEPMARAAAERVVIEWLMTRGVYPAKPAGMGEWGVRYHSDPPGVTRHVRSTVSAALLAALDSIGGEG